jgi:hypothetical protein
VFTNCGGCGGGGGWMVGLGPVGTSEGGLAVGPNNPFFVGASGVGLSLEFMGFSGGSLARG